MTTGEFFVLGFEGRLAPQRLPQICERWSLGGAVLFARNIEAPAQVAQLNAALRRLRADGKLLIAVDQEGGKFQRLKPPAFGAYPAARDLPLTQARATAQRLGAELARLGFNLDFAPVLDVDTNPANPIIGVRSFGRDPHHVAAVGREFMAGLHAQGVWACGKHFPGHGDTDTDSHLTLPRVSHPLQRLREVELLPFRALFAAGLRVLMPAHIVYPALDDKLPATYSPTILTTLLRDEMHYAGVVITDDMGMAGATAQGDLPDTCIEAFAAGCDLLLVCEHHDRQAEAIAALDAAIKKSAALQARAEHSRTRIRQLDPGPAADAPMARAHPPTPTRTARTARTDTTNATDTTDTTKRQA